MSFEDKVKELEIIVKKLETPDMGLDEGAKLFDAGVKISKECLNLLNAKKGEIVEIKKQLDEVKETPFKKD